jgi:cytoskeletal protein CcmA (bactofilin family)
VASRSHYGRSPSAVQRGLAGENKEADMRIQSSGTPVTLLAVTGQTAKMNGKFEIADSVHVECEVGGELIVGGQLVIGERGIVNATVKTVDAIIHGAYEGDMVASGTVEITVTGKVTGNIETDSLVIAKGGFFNGNVIKKSRAAGASTTSAPTVEYASVERLAVAL